MKTVLVLAMHGAPPKDFPPRELGEYFGLHARFETAPHSLDNYSRARYIELDEKMRHWQRTSENDPFFTASHILAERLAQVSGIETQVGFNEFCAPTLEEAIVDAVAGGAACVVVVTPMMTAGGEHAEKDIPAELERLRARLPEVDIRYAWPFDVQQVAEFLNAQVSRHLR
jgi:sirohydrochlorin cobaltochelatase